MSSACVRRSAAVRASRSIAPFSHAGVDTAAAACL
jgi:hypothetical protein